MDLTPEQKEHIHPTIETKAMMHAAANLGIRALAFALRMQCEPSLLNHEYSMVLAYKVLEDIANGKTNASELYGSSPEQSWAKWEDEQGKRLASLLVDRYKTCHDMVDLGEPCQT